MWEGIVVIKILEIIIKVLNLMENKTEIISIFENAIIAIANIAVSIIIFKLGQKYLENQDKKILEDNKVNRLAQYQSLIALNKKIEIITRNDSVCNYTTYEINQNVLLSEKDKIINGMAKCFEMNIYLNNFSSVYPNEVIINKLSLWDNTEDKNEQANSKQLIFFLKNSDNKFKPITINTEKEVVISILCCLTNDEHAELVNYDSTGKMFSINADITIKNVCNIYTDCQLYGTLKEEDKKDVGTSNRGDSKTQRNYTIKNGYLKILKIYEKEEIDE